MSHHVTSGQLSHKGAYYNENDKGAAAWLRQLIISGHIAPGDVDERSIEDVTPSDLAGYTQCHFFAGTGIWSYALRQAGWSDSRPCWTGSCPCQPFSAAGQGAGLADERHLWPAWFHLIEQCKPVAVFGEQVASPDGLGWLDLVHADMEGAGYAFGANDICAAGVGAPHIRQRLYFMAHADEVRQQPPSGRRLQADTEHDAESRSDSVQLAHADSSGLERLQRRGETGAQGTPSGHPTERGGPVRLDHANSAGLEGHTGHDSAAGRQGTPGSTAASGVSDVGQPGPVNGFWKDADWLSCRDGKWRPVEPSTSPLAHGAAARVVRLRGYGNGLCAPVATAFIKAGIAAIQQLPHHSAAALPAPATSQKELA